MSVGARLSVVDEMFLRTHRGFGYPIALQGLWSTTETVDPDVLEAVHADLATGPLARMVVYPRIPGARPRWARSSNTHPLDYPDVIVDGVLHWADHQADVELDPSIAPAWRLTAARTASGTVVSLVCSHAIADARGLIGAAGMSFSGAPGARELTHGRSDAADAIGLTGSVLYRSLRASAGLAKRENRSALQRYTRGSNTAETANTMTSTVVTVDADRWDAVASGNGGSVNSMFITIVAGIARRCGLNDPVTVDIPFGTASKDANAIGIATITVALDDSPSEVKQQTKRAFERPVGAPAGFPAEIVQLMPQKIAARMTSTPGRGQVLCSNIGDIPPSLNRLGPHRAAGLVTRAIHPHAEGLRTRTRMSSYISRMLGRYTLSLVAADIPRGVLDDAVSAELERWDLAATRW